MLLQQVDRVEITVLVDNVTDMLIQGSPHATRASFFKGTEMLPCARAALIGTYLNNISSRVLFDTGAGGDVILFNVDRLRARALKNLRKSNQHSLFLATTQN